MPVKFPPGVCRHCNQSFSGTSSTMFCGSACYHASRKAKTERACKACGKTFHKKSQGHHGLPVYCSMTCQARGRARRKAFTCEQCGVAFERKVSYRNKARFCSFRCKCKSLEHSVDMTCERCGSVFSVAFKRRVSARFCSRMCKIRFQDRSETRIERDVRYALDALRLEYKQEYKIWRYAIDFFLPAHNVALEVDGEYWHEQPAHKLKDERRDAFLQARGIKTVRLKGSDILNAANLPEFVICSLESHLNLC